MIKYYKRNNGEIYEARETELTISENCEEITEEEYNAAVSEINEKIQAEAQTVTAQEKSYVEQLEAENAALLYQVLTGEEFTDV